MCFVLYFQQFLHYWCDYFEVSFVNYLIFFRHTFAKWLIRPQWLHFLPRAGQTWRYVVVQAWSYPLHWPSAARLTATLPDWFPRAFTPGNLLKDCIALIALSVALLSLLLLDEIRCWCWWPISIFTAILRAPSGSTVSRRNSRWISSSNKFVMKMSLIITSSQFSKSQFSGNSFKML